LWNANLDGLSTYQKGFREALGGEAVDVPNVFRSYGGLKTFNGKARNGGDKTDVDIYNKKWYIPQ